MTDFERALVRVMNRYFENTSNIPVPPGISYRLKQAKFQDQKLDVLVDNPFIGIECKSIKLSSTSKLYFTQHFSEKDGTHQVEAINNFLTRSGRVGWLALEIKKGRGKQREAFLLRWSSWVRNRYQEDRFKGIPVDPDHYEQKINDGSTHVFRLYRNGDTYEVPERFIEYNKEIARCT